MRVLESHCSSITFVTETNGAYLSSQLSLYQPSYSRIIGESFREVNRRRRSRRGIRENFHRLSGFEIYDEAMTAVLGGGKLPVLAGQVNIESDCFFTVYQVWFQAAEPGRLERALDHYPSTRVLQRQLEA
jgi:hypothetical protein